MKLPVTLVSIFFGALLPILAIMTIQGIQAEAAQQQAALQETLSKGCPMAWANIDKVRSMPQYKEVQKWCPEA